MIKVAPRQSPTRCQDAARRERERGRERERERQREREPERERERQRQIQYIYNLPHPHRICVFLILQLNSNANLLRICPHFVFMFFLPIWSSLWKDFIKGKGGPPFKSYSGGQDSRMRKSEKGFHMVFGDKN